MRDYAAISKRLRRYSENCVAYKLDADFADAVSDAADAIEELLGAICNYCTICPTGKRHPCTCEMVNSLVPEPPKGVE